MNKNKQLIRRIRGTLTKPKNTIQPPTGMLYTTPDEALKVLREEYNYWTGRLTDSSFNLSIALIAANWAVFGSVDKILTNHWAKGSIALILLLLGINLIGCKILGEWHDERIKYAEANPNRWHTEFSETFGKSNSWPFSNKIISLSKLLRWCKTWLPLFGGGMFLVALLLP
ncbi:hypothetical protein RO575_07855 [Methylomonas sp. MO1]|uniref:hypothetical protein n=1 Tax=unclassified Methylomonas TaxID=2608980 RepID=UPI0004792C02|nr:MULTISPECIES: hypothetical protein [unclassified Methylomonas]MDT4289470.1 hypothetical protein [Methylomonas sp. MO1]